MKPMLLGASMAIVMLFMLHETLMSGAEFAWSIGAVAFVLAHIAVAIALLSLSLVFPRVRHAIAEHRPSRRHFMSMVLGMTGTVVVAHLFMHGGLA